MITLISWEIVFAIVIVGIVVVGAAASVGFGLARLWILARLVRDDGRNLMEVRAGPTAASGTARVSEGTVTAPFSGTECLLYEAGVQASDTHLDSKWRRVASETDCVPFHISDATGSITVDPTDAKYMSTERDQTVSEPGEHLDERKRQYLEDVDVDHGSQRKRVGPVEYERGDRHRFTERRLEPGDDVYVLGVSRHPSSAHTEIQIAGGEDNVKGLLLGLPFVVAEDSPSAVFRRIALKGVVFTGIGLFFGAPTGIALFSLILTLL